MNMIYAQYQKDVINGAEVWVDINWVKTLEVGKYAVSSKGRVRNNNNKRILKSTKRQHRNNVDIKGCYYVSFTGINNTHNAYSVCRLVASAFIDNIGIDTNGLIAYNLDGDVSNNNANNISWMIGGPLKNTYNNTKIDISYLNDINSIIINNNHLDCTKITNIINETLGLNISNRTLRKYRSLLSNRFVEAKSITEPEQFWKSKNMVNECIKNGTKNTKIVLKINYENKSIIEEYDSVRTAIRYCHISDRRFYKCVRNDMFIVDKITGEKYILKYKNIQ